MAAASGLVVFESFGVVVAIQVVHACSPQKCTCPQLIDELGPLLPPGAVTLEIELATRDSEQLVVRIECQGDQFVVSDRDGSEQMTPLIGEALHLLDGAIRATIAVHSPGNVFIHAGVVVIDERALVLPGRSMAGKTTLVAALVSSGAIYMSDEYAVLDAQGMVTPYARRLSVRSVRGRREVPVSEYGGLAGEGSFPVALVAELIYQPDALWNVHQGGQAACARALVSNAVAAQIRPSEVLRVCALLARQAQFVSGTRGEVSDAVAAIRKLL